MLGRGDSFQHHRLRRAGLGFTMIELLVVISIIVLLAALVLGTLGGMIVGARGAATKATVEKLSGLIDERRRSLGRHLDDLGRQVEKYTTQELWNKRNPNGGTYFQYSSSDIQLAKILAKKDYIREALPQRFADVAVSVSVDYDNSDPMNPKYVRNWTFLRADAPTTQTLADPNGTESAEALYYALTGEPIPNVSIVTATGTVVTANANYRISIPGLSPLGTDLFSGGEVGDTDGDGRMEFLDGWGQPLRFYRWPTRLLRPTGYQNGVYTHPNQAALLDTGLPSDFDLQRDPDDPLGRTQKKIWSGSPTFETYYHTPSTFHTPMIVSAGSDGILGLHEPYDYSTTNYGYLCNATDLTNPDALTDNITNLNVRAGGN